MTGFLGRLAARIVGPAPMLGPRQPSMFEAARFADSVNDVADGRQAGAVAAAPIGDAPTAAIAARKFNSRPPIGEAERVPDRRSRRGRPSTGEPPDAVSPVVPAAPTRRAAPAADEHPRIFPRTSAVVETEVNARRLAEGDGTLRPGTLAVRAPLYPAQPNNASAPRVAGTSGQSHASTEPVVHVSIGRVELRAQTPSKPIRHHQSPPGTSLDDYLRQRGDRARP